MRFLFVAQGFPGVPGTGSGSGIGTYLRELTTGLIDLGHECHVIVWAKPEVDDTHDKHCCVGRTLVAENGTRIYALKRSYWPILERLMPDSRDVFNLRRFVASVERQYCYDRIEVQNEEGIAFGVQRDYRTKTVLRVHTTLRQMVEYKQIVPTWRVRARVRRETVALCGAERVWVTTTFHRDEMSKTYGLRNIKIVPIGIDVPAKKERRVDQTVPLFIIIGHPDRRKGFDRIIPALRSYAGRYGVCRCAIVSHASIDQRKVFGLDQACQGVEMSWYDRISDTELHELLLQASALFHPARYESFGLPLIEAAARGVPIVTTATGVAVDLMQGALRNFLVEADDPEACAKALYDAVCRGKEIGGQLAVIYERGFTRARMVETWLENKK